MEEEYGRKLRSMYEVGGFPKELIIDAKGKLIDKIGSFDTPEDFFARVKESVKGTETLAGLEEAYNKNPENLITSIKLARKYNNIYKRDLALEILEKIIKRKSELKSLNINSEIGNESINAYEYTSFLHARTNRNNVSGMEKFVNEFPNSKFTEEVYQNMCSIYSRSGNDDEKGKIIIAAAMKKYPENDGIQENFVRFSIRTGWELDRAEKITGDYLKMNPESISALRYGADIQLKKGNDNKAMDIFGPKYYKEKIEPKPEDRNKASLLNSYAWFWAERGKNLESSIKASKKSIEIRPDAHGYWDTLSLLYLKQKKYDEALKAEEKALELSPGNSTYKRIIKDIKAEMSKNNK